MQTRREFLSTTGTIAATSALGLMNTGCIEIDQPSLQDKMYGGVSKASSVRTPSAVTEVSGDILLHTLKRTSFGLKQSAISYATTIGLHAYIEEQLQANLIQDDLVDDYIAKTYPRLLMRGKELIGPNGYKAHGELKEATIYRMVKSNRQLFEVMVDFWNDHFNIDGSTGRLTRYKSIDDREVIRKHALGNFRDLLHASAKSPAMLVYLNNDTNTKTGPNENYAREVMELHTLGINGGYTEQDVKEAARCFTGWNVDDKTIRFKYRGYQHDNQQKYFLDRQIPSGQGVEDGEQVLDILLDHPATAQHIATKLVRRFVSDNPPESLVNQVAEAYRTNAGDIPSMLRVILYSNEFSEAGQRKFKRPTEYLASVYRAFDIDTTTVTRPKARSVLKTLGQTPFEWPSPDGYPDVASHWNNTQGLATRWEFSLTLSEALFNPRNVLLPDWIISVHSAKDLVDQFTQRILHQELDSQSRETLLQLVTGNDLEPEDQIPEAKIVKLAATISAALLSLPAFILR